MKKRITLYLNNGEKIVCRDAISARKKVYKGKGGVLILSDLWYNVERAVHDKYGKVSALTIYQLSREEEAERAHNRAQGL